MVQSFFDLARQKFTRNSAIFILILLIAAFFRFYRLTEIPPGLNNDEAFNLLDLLNVLKGQFSIFFAANTGREPLWFYLNTATVAFFGANAFALRLTAAIVGTATVGLVWGFTRTLFRSTLIAALASLFAAISVWHIFYSRYGLRIILAVPLTLLALWWFWRALSSLASHGQPEQPHAEKPHGSAAVSV
ncbi:MAG TPA: glycosyltransferase family 39 protein, partial [Anaerolineae bacterium]